MTKIIFLISFILLGLTQSTLGQKAVSPTKKKLVSELVKNTSAIFPTEAFETVLLKSTREKAAKLESDLATIIANKIDEDFKLKKEEKAEIKAKIPALAQTLSKISKETLENSFFIKKWVNEAFQQNYSKKFTVAELQKLNAYFQTSNGKNVVQIFKSLIIGGISDDKKVSDTPKDALMENFMKKSFAEKFFNVLLENIFGDVTQKTESWGKKAIQEIEKSMTNGEMKRLMEEFIATNIKL